MNWSFAPVAGRLWQKIRGYRPLEELSDRKVSISSLEVTPLTEAVFLPGELERINGAHSMAASISDEIEQTLAPNLTNIETRAYLIRNAVIADNRVSTWAGFKDISLRSARTRPVRITEKLETAALCSSWQGNDYFSHFLLDDAATHSLAGRFGDPFFSGAGTSRSAHCLDYLSRFGIDYKEKQNILVRKLWLFRDFSLSTDKRRRLKDMAERAKTLISGGSPHPGAFIRRGVTGQVRTLDNADEIEAWCASQGFAIIDPEHQSVDDICAALHGVPLVIGVEGSHLTHALFAMRRGGTLICIQPPDRFNAIFRHLCAAFGIGWGFVVAKGTVEGFSVELDRLKATIDLAQMQPAS